METAAEWQTLSLRDVPLRLMTRGGGQPLLLLHPEIGIDPGAPFLDLLAERHHLILPIHPGFNLTDFADGIDSVDDLAYLYLDLLKVLGLRDVCLVGLSLGGWIAAEIAVRSCERLSRLVLVGPLGIKVSDRETRDIVDVFALSDEAVAQHSYFDPGVSRRDYANLPDDEVLAVAQNREAAARYGWSPYMHNPKLKQRLYRIDVPVFVLSGADDRLVRSGYGAAYANAMANARFGQIERAGHFPHIEQPEQLGRAVLGFSQNARAIPSREVAR